MLHLQPGHRLVRELFYLYNFSHWSWSMAFSLAGLLLAGFNITTTVYIRTLGFFFFENRKLKRVLCIQMFFFSYSLVYIIAIVLYAAVLLCVVQTNCILSTF